MDALLDSEVIISGNHVDSVSAPFEGITLVNRGGDFAFRNVTVMGSAQ